MKRIVEFITKYSYNKKYSLLFRGILMGIMIVLIFLSLINKDYSTAPTYIYNQF